MVPIDKEYNKKIEFLLTTKFHSNEAFQHSNMLNMP